MTEGSIYAVELVLGCGASASRYFIFVGSPFTLFFILFCLLLSWSSLSCLLLKQHTRHISKLTLCKFGATQQHEGTSRWNWRKAWVGREHLIWVLESSWLYCWGWKGSGCTSRPGRGNNIPFLTPCNFGNSCLRSSRSACGSYSMSRGTPLWQASAF